MNCDPATLASASRCWCFPADRQRAARIFLLCSWANAGAAPVILVPSNIVLPVITGTAQIGFTLTGSNGTWTNTPTGYTYRWLANGVAIGGATASTFLLTSAQLGAVITFEVTAKNAGGSGTPATSTGTSAVLPAVPVNSVLPAITGTAQIGFTLTGSNGTWSNTPTGYSYQWLSNGVNIGGATANTFTLLTAQIGTTITFTVTASNAGGSGTVATSSATAVVLGASFQVTTTAPSQVLTITLLTVSSSMTVDWGDSSQNAYTGSGIRTHTYAVAGTYTVQFLAPLLVTALELSDSKVTLNSSQIKTILNVTDFEISSLKAGTFNSADVSAWRPANFNLNGMPSGYAGTFNSADVSAWRPTYFNLNGMPSGYAGTFNSADVSAWRPTYFWLLSMPAATFTTTITPGGFAGWIGVSSLSMSAMALTQTQVNQILTDLYTAFPTRIVTGGTITLNGTGNAAPSGTYQSVTPPTSGKETAYDLINDPTSINPTKKWATITTN